jgi:hypothetical protein
MEGMSLGGELVLVSACLTVTPPITGGQEHTHKNTHSLFLQPVQSECTFLVGLNTTYFGSVRICMPKIALEISELALPASGEQRKHNILSFT